MVPSVDKTWIMDAIREEGVMANVHYSPLHRNRYYNHLASDSEMDGSVKFFNSFLRLPIYVSMTELEIERVVDSVRKVFNAL